MVARKNIVRRPFFLWTTQRESLTFQNLAGAFTRSMKERDVSEIRREAPKMPRVFRMTFNVPAERQYFYDDDRGLRIRISDGNVLLKAVPTVQGSDAVEVEKRARGGREVTIDGESSGVLLDLLLNQGATQSRPFFILHKGSANDNGWLRLEHFAEDGAPPKVWPHVRLWPPRDAISLLPTLADRDDDAVVAILGDFALNIRQARHIVNTHFAERKIGRPPREVSEAERVLEMFSALAYEVLPSLDPRIYLQHVELASGALSELTSLIQARVSALKLPVSRINDEVQSFLAQKDNGVIEDDYQPEDQEEDADIATVSETEAPIDPSAVNIASDQPDVESVLDYDAIWEAAAPPKPEEPQQAENPPDTNPALPRY